MVKKFFPQLALAVLFAGCSDINTVYDNPITPNSGHEANIVENSQYGGYIDWQTYAGDDFYRYATGAWQDATDLGGRNVVGTQFLQNDLELEFTKKVVSEGGCPLLQRLFTQYKGMDDYNADKQKVIDKLNDIANSVTTKEQAWKKMAELMKEGYALPFDYGVGSIKRQIYRTLRGNKMVFTTVQDDMKEFATPEQLKEIMASVNKVWPNAGDDDDDDDNNDGKRSAKRHSCIKAPLMPVSVCLGIRRAGGNANDTPIEKILSELDIKVDDILSDNSVLKTFNENLEKASLADIVNFMKYCVISRDRHFVAGAQKASQIVETLLNYDNTPLKLTMSHYYCQSIVDPKSRIAVKEMGEILRQTLMNRMERNPWLDAVSKAGAKEKLKKMIIQVGWPDQWEESAEARVKDNASMNTFDLICDLFSQRASKTVSALAGKTDADHLFLAQMTETPAWESNAYYIPSDNEVIICASNLMPPVYDPSKDIIYNYAMMGAPTLGHEMTHGFDATGSLFDATGAEREWMSPQARETFKSMTNKVEERYNGWEYYPQLFCNGKKTVTENTADMGGLCIAYEALMGQHQGSAAEKLYVAREYYRAFAYGWMEKGTFFYYVEYVLDTHAPGSLRVNGCVREMDEFYEAFGITSGSMFITPQDRIHIW